MLNGFKNPGRVALIGGNSEIGLSIISGLPENKSREVLLVNRTGDFSLDVTDRNSRERIVEQLFKGGDLDIAVIAVGLLGNNPELNASENLLAMMDVNYVSTAHLIELIAGRMKRQSHGKILVISSFAQARPRPDNFRYGSTKAALDFYARGLALELEGTGVAIKILRPGFVKSKMTAGMDVAPFAISVEEAGKYGVAALRSKKLVTWAPSILKYVAFVFKALPPSIFRKIASR